MVSELLKEPRFWEVVCFLIAALIVVVKGRSGIASAIKARIDVIREALEESQSLRQEAQDMLDNQKSLYKKVEAQSKDIIKAAQEEATLYRNEMRKKMDNLIAARERQAFDRVKQLEEKAIQDVKAYTSDLAISAATRFLGEKKGINICDRKIASMLKHLSEVMH